jgi:hypothetical protein
MRQRAALRSHLGIETIAMNTFFRDAVAMAMAIVDKNRSG